MNKKFARFMVVDDEPVIRTFILNSLRRLGYHDFHEFPDGSAALAQMLKVRPDVIITDIHMKPMGGIEFVRHLRAQANDRLSRTKVIFLTADATPETVKEAVPLGVTGYIVKPPKLEALQAKVELALRD